MDAITTIFVMALVVETLIEYFSDLISKRLQPKQIIAILLGQAAAWGLGISVFDLINVPFKWPWVGVIIIGLGFSKGAGWLHDWLDNLVKRAAGGVDA